MLVLEPVDHLSGYRNGSDASWGGNAIFADGKWHLFVGWSTANCEPVAAFGVQGQQLGKSIYFYSARDGIECTQLFLCLCSST